MAEPVKDQDISFELSDDLLAKLQPITRLAAGRKQLLICSVKQEAGWARPKLVFHAAFHDAKYIAQNGPFGPPRPDDASTTR
jgi:hypothetical protein